MEVYPNGSCLDLSCYLSASVNIFCPNGCAKSKVSVVRPAHCLINFVVLENRQHGTKLLLCNKTCFIPKVCDDGWRNEISRFFEGLSSFKNTHALVLTGILDKPKDFFILHLILDGSHLNIWFKAVAHPMCTSELGEDFNKRFIEGLRSINTFHSNTYLARIAHGAIKNTHCRTFKVSII